MSTKALVTVIIPTHNHNETLPYSVRSVLEQTIADLQIVIIGDGVTEEVRTEAERLCARDSRVTFQDQQKTARRGELLRDTVIRDSSSRFIAYNCDDDLWFPQHLETLINLIGEHHFAHPLPILIGADGVPFFMPSDLQRLESVQWHLSETPRNTISLSGVMHTRDAYLRLPYGWRETPPGRWTDHYMWQQFFEQEWFSGITSSESTTLKLMAQGRDDAAPGERRADIEKWWNRLHDPSFVDEWELLVHDAMWKSAVDHNLVSTFREDEIKALRKQIEEMCKELLSITQTHTNEISQLNKQLNSVHESLGQSHAQQERLRTRISQLRQQLDSVYESRSWKITKPLRDLRRSRTRIED